MLPVTLDTQGSSLIVYYLIVCWLETYGRCAYSYSTSCLIWISNILASVSYTLCYIIVRTVINFIINIVTCHIRHLKQQLNSMLLLLVCGTETYGCYVYSYKADYLTRIFNILACVKLTCYITEELVI